MRTSTKVVFFVLAALFASAVYAEEAAPETAPEPTPSPEKVSTPAADDDEFEFSEKEVEVQAAPKSIDSYGHPDAHVYSIIPDYLGKAIPAGTVADVLVLFQNTGEMPLMVKHVFGALVSPVDASRFIQNFTSRAADIVVEPHTETTIAYRITPSQYLPEQPFRLLTLLDYIDPASNRYFSVAFNDTIHITEKRSAFDIELILTYAILIGTVAGILYLIYGCVSKKTTKGAAAKAPRVVNSEEWLSGTSADASYGKKKNTSRKQGGSKKKN